VSCVQNLNQLEIVEKTTEYGAIGCSTCQNKFEPVRTEFGGKTAENEQILNCSN
jgi:hypothetical protein